MSNFKVFNALNYNAGITILNIVFGFFLNIYLVNQLGLKDFGSLSVILIYSTVIYSFSILGLGSTLVHKFVELRHKKINIKPLFFLLYIFVQIFGLLILYFVYEFGIFFHLKINNFPLIVFFVIVQTLIGFPVSLLTAFFESIQSMKIVFIANLFSVSSKFLGIIFISFFLDKIFASLFIIYFIPNFFSLIILSIGFNYIYSNTVNFTSFNYIKEFLRIFVFSLKFSPVIVAELLLANFVFIFFSGIEKLESFAVLRILLGFFTMSLTLPSIVGRTMLPFFSDAFLRSRMRLFNFYNSFIFKLSFIFFCFFATFLIIVSREVLSLYKIDFLAYQNLYFLIVTMIFLMFSSYQGSILISIGKPHYISLILIFGTVVHVGLVLFIYPYISIVVLLITLLVSYFLMQILLNFIIAIKLKLKFNFNLIIIFSFTLFTNLLFCYYILDFSLCMRFIFFSIYLFALFIYLIKFNFFNYREFSILEFFLKNVIKKAW
jgi:O-antigen/teichoic acid export membrane protein